MSKTVFYDQRLIISPPLETPICWKISKVEGVNPLGIMMFTCVQDRFNPHTDWIEKDDKGNWVAAWADYFKSGNVEQGPEPDPSQDKDYAIITYSGTVAQIKVGGSYKSITITYYNSNEIIENQQPGDWSFWIDNINVNELIQIKSTDSDNTIKIKFTGDEDYLGKLLVVKNIRDEVVAELNLEIVSL